jgi:hypothetical protein
MLTSSLPEPSPGPTVLPNIAVKTEASLLEFDIHLFRKSLQMTQRQFAYHYDINIATVKRWEKWANPTFDDTFKKILIDYLALPNHSSSIPEKSLLSIVWNHSLSKSGTVFQKIVNQIIEYKEIGSLPPWAWQKIDWYPKTLAWLEEFKKDAQK